MNIPLIPQDKANHGVYGAGVAAVTASLAVIASAPPWAAALLGAGAALAVGLVKERLDARANAKAAADPATAGLPPPHGVERGDVVATAVGGVLVALPLAVAGLVGMGV